MNESKITENQGLSRQLGLLGLAATGICSMLGASVYVVPFMIQRNVPGIGPYVLPAFPFSRHSRLVSGFWLMPFWLLRCPEREEVIFMQVVD